MMGRGGGGGGRGRGRHRREHSPRSEDKGGHSGRGEAPPSRHLWVGNISPHVTQSLLSEHFLRFGDLESIIFLPGRSYAFVNYKKEEDAVVALRSLHGVSIAGSPLKIEFQKADKSSLPLETTDYARDRDERRSADRGESFSRRDWRSQPTVHDNFEGDKSLEPSEVLWIGFPAFLHVDEASLGRAFAPFGEIEKITTFPGRSYAFLRYRSVVAACRAKEALQGKLFNNPRVRICFAKSDLAPEHGRDSSNLASRPNYKSNSHAGADRLMGETTRWDRNIDSSTADFTLASPRYFSDMEKMPRDSVTGFGRNNLLGADAGPGPNSNAGFESFRFQGLGSERRIAEDPYDQFRNSPPFERGAFRHDHPVERPRRSTHFEDSWGMEDNPFPLTKKIRLDAYTDGELPEFPFSDYERETEHTGLPKFVPDLQERQMNKKIFESMPSGYKSFSDNPNNISHPLKNDDFWRASDAFDAGPSPCHPTRSKLQRFTPESHQPLNEEWKWEGTIAKGGTPVCRARCFPVGKVMDMMLPEFLDCTARTGLDMLSKHFYQAASSWVVFFVPETDADIVFYNEFMHYLGEKQRAAVAKLGEKTTLFLVPPSEFSEQVLKVPGKVSISGVILKFQDTSSFGAPHPSQEADPSIPSYIDQKASRSGFHNDTSQANHILPDFRSFQGQSFIGSSSEHFTSTGFQLGKHSGSHTYPGPTSVEKIPSSAGVSRYDQLQHQNPSLPPSWSHDVRASDANIGHLSSPAPNASSRSFDNTMAQEYPLLKSNVVQGMSSGHYMPENQDTALLGAGKFLPPQGAKHQVPSSAPAPPLQPEQLAQLAALLNQQKHLGKDLAISSSEEQKQPNTLEKTVIHGQVTSDSSASQFNKVQQLQQYSPNVSSVNQAANPERHGSQQVQHTGREEPEADPQKRLQATLQLAAALLQQIQQQSKSDQVQQ